MDGTEMITTLMIKNLPSRCQREEVMKVMDESGFEDLYDFFYLPSRAFERRQNFGYAFVNFVSAEDAQRFRALVHREGLKVREKQLDVVSANVQGLANLESHFQGKLVSRTRAAPIFRSDLTEESVGNTPCLLSTAAPPQEPSSRQWLPAAVPGWSASPSPTLCNLPSAMKVDVPASDPCLDKDARGNASSQELSTREQVPTTGRGWNTSSAPTWTNLPLPMKVENPASYCRMPMKVTATYSASVTPWV
eukprot:TRINITY_DN103640_c0_g1_i1.p1 TRINITY_DN103640_c0_g1~~TRINITY_DN103640_c0_g1_i1.p1  ORF type:complete len:278 (-),score=35.18 TRINITY_DN103640_c0_g1_i1:299-1045(-)